MTLYVETSALVSVLFCEADSQAILDVINRADSIVTSALTLIEAKRACVRFPDRKISNDFLKNLSLKWVWFPIDDVIQERSGEPFPIEPMRTLDAIHLATALECVKVFPDTQVLSLDKRILENLEPLGLVGAKI